MNNFKDWSGDAQAQAVYRQLEDGLIPILARLMPEFNMVKLGINKPDPWSDSQEVRLIIHLKPNGLRMPRPYSKDLESDSNAMQTIALEPI